MTVRAAYQRMVTMDGKLDKKAVRSRAMFFWFTFLICNIGGSCVAVRLVFDHEFSVGQAGIIVCVGVNACVMLLTMCGVHHSTFVHSAWLVGQFLGIAMLDVDYHTIMSSSWYIFVLTADVVLLLRMNHKLSIVFSICVVTWITFVLFETIFRFGFFDMPLTYSQDHRRKTLMQLVSCDTLPCPLELTSVATSVQAEAIAVFVVDFASTRYFAMQMEKEQDSMETTIDAVKDIATHLAAYDVEAVHALLMQCRKTIPPDMHAALRSLEQNLRAYRPYLPAVLLEEQQPSHAPDNGPCVPSAAAPGEKSNRAAIVFTDIRSSTSIWEAAPEAMKKAMVVHNTVIRSAQSAWGGYEVKTIGDAFMVAFEDAHAAVCFGMDVQEKLLASEWPAALLQVEICSPTGLWGGLTVRVGVNEGPVTLETNNLTGRVDYFGHTVNVASRLESVCVPGAVAVPAELWTLVRGMSGCVGAYAGNVVPINLKGVSVPVPVCSVWPACLQGREGRPLQAAVPSRPATPPGSLNTTGSRKSLSVCSVPPQGAVFFGGTQQDVTVAAATLSSMSLGDINSALTGFVPLLEQSDGVLLSLLGNNFFIGWNIGKAVTAHAESALQFAQRVLQHGEGQTVATLGIASGTVEHGDVGTARQRFVTASGGAVEASLALRRLALSMHVRCLYTAEAPPGAVREQLRATTARVSQHAGSGSVVYEMEALSDAQDPERIPCCDNPSLPAEQRPATGIWEGLQPPHYMPAQSPSPSAGISA